MIAGFGNWLCPGPHFAQNFRNLRVYASGCEQCLVFPPCVLGSVRIILASSPLALGGTCGTMKLGYAQLQQKKKSKKNKKEAKKRKAAEAAAQAAGAGSMDVEVDMASGGDTEKVGLDPLERRGETSTLPGYEPCPPPCRLTKSTTVGTRWRLRWRR